MTRRVLVVRLDRAGDVLLAGPAVRAVAAAAEVALLCGPAGTEAGAILPGVRRVLEWAAPWVITPAPPVHPDDVRAVVEEVGRGGFAEAVVLTSFHQSPLPTALLLRLAGVERITGASVDYPGALLDVRLRPGSDVSDDLPEDLPEPERALRIAAAAGFRLPAGDDGRLAVRIPRAADPPTDPPYVVLHPGAAVTARRWPAGHFRHAAQLLAGHGLGRRGHRRTRRAGAHRLRSPAGAASTSAGGPASPSWPRCSPGRARSWSATPAPRTWPPRSARRWCRCSRRSCRPCAGRPYRVPQVLLGDQDAPCRDTRARECPVPGHPCLSRVAPRDVVAAARQLVDRGRLSAHRAVPA